MLTDSIKAKLALIPGIIIGLIAGLHPLMWGLAGLQVLDILSGLMASKSSWSSAFANVGMKKKTMMWIYVLTGHILKTISPTPIDFPVGALIAGYFCVVEVISIKENGERLGVKPPAPLLRIIRTFSQMTVETDGAVETKKEVTVTVSAPPPAD